MLFFSTQTCPFSFKFPFLLFRYSILLSYFDVINSDCLFTIFISCLFRLNFYFLHFLSFFFLQPNFLKCNKYLLCICCHVRYPERVLFLCPNFILLFSFLFMFFSVVILVVIVLVLALYLVFVLFLFCSCSCSSCSYSSCSSSCSSLFFFSSNLVSV